MNNLITTNEIKNASSNLASHISQVIEHAKGHIAREYNSTQVLLCWSIGKYINKKLLDLDRGDYGEKVIEFLAQELLVKYWRGYIVGLIYLEWLNLPGYIQIKKLSQHCRDNYHGLI